MREDPDHGQRPIRVLLVSVPRMLCSILEATARDWPDVAVVGSTGETNLDVTLHDHDPDVLILGMDESDDLEARAELLRASPRLRILGITPDGRRVSVLELRPQVSELGNLSPSELFGAIRAGAGW